MTPMLSNLLYPIARRFLFSLDPEDAHELTFSLLDLAQSLRVAGLLNGHPKGKPVRVMGIDFPNQVGLSAGLDKNGAHIDGLAALGFGFLEIGTITPRPQPGNPKPRMFRLPARQALINRLGFNNEGVEALLKNVAAARYKGVLGINIGKNFDTPIERAVDDYLLCLRKVYMTSSYITVNISSPNTQNLRQLQSADPLAALLRALKDEQAKLADAHGAYRPIAVKIAPDLTPEEVSTIARLLAENRIDAVIATNTTLDRSAVQGLTHANETGGLSGAPVREASNRVIRQLSRELDGALPVIGVGGILSAKDAKEKIDAGASLIQLYTGLIYRGPALVSEVIEALSDD